MPLKKPQKASGEEAAPLSFIKTQPQSAPFSGRWCRRGGVADSRVSRAPHFYGNQTL